MAGALGTSWPSSVSAGLIEGSPPTCCLGPDSFVFVPFPCTPVALLSCDALDPAAPPPLPGGISLPPGPPHFVSVPYLWAAVMAAASSLIPGPIVVLRVTPFRYTPFAVAGLARMMVSRIVFTLSWRRLGPKEALSTSTGTTPALHAMAYHVPVIPL